MKTKSVHQSQTLSRRKKILFTVFTFLIPLFIFLIIELGLRLFQYGGDTRLFISAPDELSDYYMINHEVGNRYFFMQNTVPDPPKDIFLKKKPKNGFRIFVLGGSTTAGFPYGNNVMFSRILHQRLIDTYPYKHIEMVNIGMSAVNSYTLLDLIDEILEKSPDLILIYAGHNEYYGALGIASNEYMGKMRWFVKSYLKLNGFKVFILIRDLAAKLGKGIGRAIHKNGELDPSATLMARIVGDPVIPYGSVTYQLGKKQFNRNLDEIVKKIRKQNVPVLMSELISNVKHKPFKSVYHDTLPSAEAVFQKAQQLEVQGKLDEANQYYCWAKDLDVLRFRAPEDFNQIIHQVADIHHVPVVPMRHYFRERSQNGIIGYDLILEHLHPNVRGYFIMAEAFYDMIRHQNIVSGYINQENVKSTSQYLQNWGITHLDSAYVNFCLMYLTGGWPFKENMGPNTTLIDYHPATKIDSLSVKIFTDEESGIETGHIDLAEWYESKKLYEQAFDEYKALLYTIPYEELFVKRAVNILIKLKDYNRALDVLFFAQKYRNTEFVNKRIGQILLLKNRIYEAIFYLENAAKLTKADTQLNYNLCQAYILSFQSNKVNQLLKQIEMNQSDPKEIDYLKSLIRETKTVYSALNGMIRKARICIGEKQDDEAIQLLDQSLKIKETPIAYYLLGKLYIQKQDIKKGIHYFNKGLKLSPYDFNLMYNLTTIYLKNDQVQNARVIYHKMCYLYPDFNDYLKIRDHFSQKGVIKKET